MSVGSAANQLGVMDEANSAAISEETAPGLVIATERREGGRAVIKTHVL